MAPTDSTIVVPTDEPVSLLKDRHAIPPPQPTLLLGLGITVRTHVSHIPSTRGEVERLLAMTTPLLSPPISLSPPSAEESLARYTAPPAHLSPPPVSSPLLPSSGCLTQIQTLRIASTQALIDAVTAVLPSPPLPPPLYIPPLVDRRDDILESEQPSRKRLRLYTLGSRYKMGGVLLPDLPEIKGDTWIDPVEAVPEVAPMTVGEVNTRVTELVELHEHDTHDLYALLEDVQDRYCMDGGGRGLCFLRGLASLDRIESGTMQSNLIQTQHQVYETRFQTQQPEIAALREFDRRRQAQMAETLRVMRDMRREMSDMHTELLAHREQ
ncbi:hypothetical protein Tco_0849798 [Tanacetum coccineum]